MRLSDFKFNLNEIKYEKQVLLTFWVIKFDYTIVQECYNIWYIMIKLRNIYFSPISRLGEILTMRLPAPAKWKNLCGSFNINQLRKLTNNANIQRLIAW